MPLGNLNTSPWSREERRNSIPRALQAMQDNYSADVTAREDEEAAQAAEYEEDDHKIKDAEDARDDEDSTYQGSSQSSGQDSQDSQSSGQASKNAQFSDEGAEGPQYCAKEAREVQSRFPDLLDSQFSYDDLQDSQDSQESQESQGSQDSQDSQSSFASDASHPPFRPKGPRKVMNPEDEDEDGADTASEATPGKKKKERDGTTAARGSATPTPRTAPANGGLPLFFPPSTPPSPMPQFPSDYFYSPRRQEAANEEPDSLPSSQASAVSGGSQEQEDLKGTWDSLFGSSPQASLGSDSGDTQNAEEEKEPEEEVAKEELEEGEVREPLARADAQRAQPTARVDAHQVRAAASAPAVLQTLDANRILNTTTAGGRDTSATADKAKSQDSENDKGSDASESPDTTNTADGGATPLARTPTQSTFATGGDRTPTARSPKTPPGKGNKNAKNNGGGQAPSPGAKPGGHKRPAEDPISPRRSSKAENRAPGPSGEEKKYKMMRKI